MHIEQKKTQTPSTSPTFNPTTSPTSQPYCPPPYSDTKTNYKAGDLVTVDSNIFKCNDDQYIYEEYCNIADDRWLSSTEKELWDNAWEYVSGCYTTTSPTGAPTVMPTEMPSVMESSRPSIDKSGMPSIHHSDQPSVEDSDAPSLHGSDVPSVEPTIYPTAEPTRVSSDEKIMYFI